MGLKALEGVEVCTTTPIDPIPMHLTEDQFAVWWGAVLDSEGFADFQGTARVAVTSTHRPTLEILQARLGGKIRELQPVERQRKTRYQLGLTGPGARAALRLARPWVLEKAPQVDLILALSPLPGPRRRLTDQDREHRALTRRQLKALRHCLPMPS